MPVTFLCYPFGRAPPLKEKELSLEPPLLVVLAFSINQEAQSKRPSKRKNYKIPPLSVERFNQ
jgi:hypothetical protein